MNDLTLRLIGLIIFVIYVSFPIACYLRYGMLSSISKYYYKLNNRWIFQLWVYSYAIPIMFLFDSLLVKCAAMLLMLVALFPTIKIKWHKHIHVFGAILSLILMYIYITFSEGKSSAAFAILIVLIGSLIDRRHCIFYAELILGALSLWTIFDLIHLFI